MHDGSLNCPATNGDVLFRLEPIANPGTMQHLTTEQRNEASANIDELSALQIAKLISSEDAKVAAAVEAESLPIAKAMEVITERLRAGGRLFYIGAGTSGRLGVLDASECPPTFSTPPEMVVGIIAGGPDALTRAIEGAEDHPEQAEIDLAKHHFGSQDVLVGIAASGRTPYVLHALCYARRLGSTTIGLTCNPESEMHPICDIVIAPIVGPEIISGSTRLKSGTATKMVLNMLTTGAMVLLGKTYGNLMVDLKASNAKLKDRSLRLVRTIAEVDDATAMKLLSECDGEVKTAIVSAVCRLEPVAARQKLADAGGQLRPARQPLS